MINFPAEIWEKIIVFAYPLKFGWHRRLWVIASLSHMHYNIVKYLFECFMKNPVFLSKTNSPFLSITNAIKYITRDLPEMDGAFLSRETTVQRYFNFKFSNFITGENFSASEYSTKRCLIAKTYIYENTRKKLNNPVIILPLKNNVIILFTNTIGSHHLRNYISLNLRNYISSILHRDRQGTPIPKKVEYIDVNNVTVWKIIKYILDENNPIPISLNALISRAKKHQIK